MSASSNTKIESKFEKSPHSMSPAIPNLRIVPVSAVLPHEEHDPQRSEPLMRRIRDAGVWLNPPIVAPIHNDPNNATDQQRYVLLDGANRHYSIQSLGIPHILVQVVEYSSQEVSLETWNHVLSNVEVGDLMLHVHSVDSVHFEDSDVDAANYAVSNGDALAYIRILPEKILLMVGKEGDTAHRSVRLRELVAAYKTIAKIDRINGDDPEVIHQLYPNAAAVVIFPQYAPEEIIVAARDDLHLPAGISRHIIQGRAMRLHYPLQYLRDTATSLVEKNNALMSWVQEQVSQRRLRLYAEATYLFDD